MSRAPPCPGAGFPGLRRRAARLVMAGTAPRGLYVGEVEGAAFAGEGAVEGAAYTWARARSRGRLTRGRGRRRGSGLHVGEGAVEGAGDAGRVERVGQDPPVVGLAARAGAHEAPQ